MKVEKRIIVGNKPVGNKTIGYVIDDGDKKLAITREDGITLGKTGIFENVRVANSCLVFKGEESFRHPENILRISEEGLSRINWTPAEYIMKNAQNNVAVTKKAKIIGAIFNSLDGALLGYRLGISNGSEIRKTLTELRSDTRNSSLFYTLQPEEVEQYKNDFNILKRPMRGGILFYYIQMLDDTLTKRQLDLLFGAENNILEEVSYNVSAEIASKMAPMAENEYIQTLIDKTNQLASITDLRINLKGKTINILGRCGMGNIYSTLEDLNDSDNKKSNTLACSVSGYVFIMPKKDIKELWKSNIGIKIQSDKILNVSSRYRTLLTNTDTEVYIDIRKKQLSKDI